MKSSKSLKFLLFGLITFSNFDFSLTAAEGPGREDDVATANVATYDNAYTDCENERQAGNNNLTDALKYAQKATNDSAAEKKITTGQNINSLSTEVELIDNGAEISSDEEKTHLDEGFVTRDEQKQTGDKKKMGYKN